MRNQKGRPGNVAYMYTTRTPGAHAVIIIMKSTKVLNPRRYLILKPGLETDRLSRLVTTCVVDSARANETHSHYGKYTENC